MKILVVDHSKVFRALWKRLVTRAGHELVIADTGKEGLRVLSGQPIDLICVSLTLPDTTGIEFCRKARKTKSNRNTPLLLLTSTEDKQARAEAFAVGVTDIYPKTDIERVFSQASRFVENGNKRISGRVLYVEDSSVVAHVMLKIFEGMGLKVDHFKSASKALEAFDHNAYDLVVSDIVVEGELSGIGLVSRIRERYPDKARVPILAMSGMDDPNRRVELFRLGVNDFVSKPVVEEEVVARASNLISNKQLFDQVQAQRRHLYDLAMLDQLTGLYNRNSLAEFVGKAFTNANRHDFDLSVVMLDIDHFKQVNDAHGHLAGDRVLSAIGELLRDNCRNEDFAVRFGGEELMLILPHCAINDAARRAEELRMAISTLEPAGIHVTASFGVTARPRSTDVSMEGMIRVADRAVYRAKRNGRDRVEVLYISDQAPQSATA